MFKNLSVGLIAFILIFVSCKKTETIITPSLSDTFVGTYSGSFSERTGSQYLDQHNLTIKVIKISDDKLNISYKDDVLYGGKTLHDIYNFELIQVIAISTTELYINENIYIYEDNFRKNVVINMTGKVLRNGNSLNLVFNNGYFSNNNKQPLYLIKN